MIVNEVERALARLQRKLLCPIPLGKPMPDVTPAVSEPNDSKPTKGAYDET